MKIIDFIEEIQKYDPSCRVVFTIFSRRQAEQANTNDIYQATFLLEPFGDGVSNTGETVFVSLVPYDGSL